MHIVDTNVIVFILFQRHEGPEVCRLLDILYQLRIFGFLTAIKNSCEVVEHHRFVRDLTFRHALKLHLLLFTLLTNHIR